MAAGNRTITNSKMSKETPISPTLSAIESTNIGYISSTGITFAFVSGACTLTIASGFSSAGFNGADDERILISSTSGLNDGLYTIESDTDTVITLGSDDVLISETSAAAGTVVLYTVGVYVITPTRATGKLLIIFSEGVESAGEAGMIPCVLNGSFWAAKNGLYKAFAATTGTDKTFYLFIETAPYLQADGTILVMLKPKATNVLYTDHRPALAFLELP